MLFINMKVDVLKTWLYFLQAVINSPLASAYIVYGVCMQKVRGDPVH